MKMKAPSNTRTRKVLKANEVYYLDQYTKDLRYLNPCNLEGRSKDLNQIKLYTNNLVKKDRGLEGKSLFKVWFREVVNGLKQFLYQGSLHGVKYIFEPTFGRIERATWIVIMVISIGICTANIGKLFDQWTSSPFVNVIDSLPTPVWAVPFPTVVLCPHLHVKLSYANVTELNSTEQFFASLICPNMYEEYRALERRLKPDQNILLQKFIVESSPKCLDVVRRCYWRSLNESDWQKEECCEKLFRPIYTNYGLCFAFNSLPLNGMYEQLASIMTPTHVCDVTYSILLSVDSAIQDVILNKTNETLTWQKTFDENAEFHELNWGLDSGYPKVFPPDLTMSPFRVMASGELNGLDLELYFNLSEHQDACDGNSLGFKIFISAPMDHVYTSTVLRLPMDRTTTIEVSPVTYKTDANLRKLAAERRQCFFQNERRLEYYEFYTDSNCKHDLLICEARKRCNCVLFNWPRKHILEPICSTMSDYRCINEVQGKVEEQLIYAYYAESEDGSFASAETVSCHPSCNDILYSSQVYYSELGNDLGYEMPEYEKLIKKGEITRVNVHFYDDILLGQHRHAQYDNHYFVESRELIQPWVNHTTRNIYTLSLSRH